MYTAVLNPTTVVEARYSGFYGTAANDPLNGGPRINRRFQDLDTGNITGGIYYWYDGKSFKTAFSGKVTKYADDFLGAQHDFKVGVQYNSGGGESVNGYNDYIYTVRIGADPTATRRIRTGAAAGCAPLASTRTTPSAGTASR